MAFAAFIVHILALPFALAFGIAFALPLPLPLPFGVAAAFFMAFMACMAFMGDMALLAFIQTRGGGSKAWIAAFVAFMVWSVLITFAEFVKERIAFILLVDISVSHFLLLLVG